MSHCIPQRYTIIICQLKIKFNKKIVCDSKFPAGGGSPPQADREAAPSCREAAGARGVHGKSLYCDFSRAGMDEAGLAAEQL